MMTIRQRTLRALCWVVAGAALAGAAGPARAYSTGITTTSFGAFGCNECHSGGQNPSVELSGPTMVLPSSINTYRFTVSNQGSQQYAGLNVSALDGVFTTGGPQAKNTQTLSGTGGRAEVTHSAPKAGKDGVTAFSFVWAAPASFSSVTLNAWGNAVNLSHSSSGDRAAMTMLAVNNGATLCPPTPATCQTPGKSSLAIRDTAGKQSLTFKWSKGPTTNSGDFGTPPATADYALCIYADTALVAEMDVDAGSEWVPTTKGFKFKDKLSPALQTVTLAAGDIAGKAKIQAKGKGAGIGLPATLPFTSASTVTVQLVNSDNTNCWGDTYSGAEITKHDADAFKAKSPNS